MSEYRTLIEEKKGRGARFELYQFKRKSHAHDSASGTHFSGHLLNSRTLRIVLEGGAALLEPGALQYAHGKLSVEVQQNEQGGFFARAVRSAGSGESAFATKYSGYGEIWTEPTTKQFIIAEMDGPGDALILDDKAFYACEASIQVKTHMHNTISGVLSGNGLMQPKLEGQGVFVVEAPVPVDEVEAVELDGSGELIVDGDLMMMYSASLSVELRPLVSGIRNAMRSGEGLVFVFRGRGTVWLTPTMRI